MTLPILQQEPILSRVSIATVISGVLLALGITVDDEVVQGISGLLVLVIYALTALRARQHATPVANPRAGDGTLLAPVSGPQAPSAAAVDLPPNQDAADPWRGTPPTTP